MKNRFLILFLLLSGWTNAQTILEWNSEIEVSDGSVYGNVRPRIVLTANDIPLIVYGNGGTKQLYASRWNGSGFSTPVPLLPANMTAYVLSWTGPDVAAKGDTVVVVFKAEPMDNGNVYTVRSTDGGMTFSDTIRVDDHDSGAAWMPSLDIDTDGNPSVIYMAHDSVWVHPRYVVTHSTDAGLSFEPSMDIAIAIPEEACDCCPAEYVINGNREVLLFRNNDNNVRDIYGVYSSDGGATYPSASQINMLNWVVTSCPSSGPHGLLRDSDLITVSMSRASGKSRVYVTTNSAASSLGTSSEFMLTPPTNVNGSQNYPRISGNQDTIVMVWQESDPSNGEIFSAFTTIGSVADFLTTKAMSNAATTGSQTNPDVVYRNGIAHLVFQDGPTGSVIYKTATFGTVGLNETELPAISVYPNPSTGEFHLTGEVDRVSDVVDLSGKSVEFNFVPNNEFGSIQVNGISGSYFVIVELNGQRVTIQVTLK